MTQTPHQNVALAFKQAPPSQNSPANSTPLRRARSGLDEGCSGESEETRSLSDCDTSMQIDPLDVDMDRLRAGDAQQAERHLLLLPPQQRILALLRLLQSLSDEEKAASITNLIASYKPAAQFEIASEALAALPTSSLAAVVEKFSWRLHINPVDRLPAELTEQIFLNLSPNDLLKCSMTARKWRERVLDSNIWKLMFGREGWTWDVAEVKNRVLKEASSRALAKSHRRKPDSDIEINGSRKRQRESVDAAQDPSRAQDTNDWNGQHGAVEADEDHDNDHKMEGVESHTDNSTPSNLNALSPLSTTTNETGDSSTHIPLSRDALRKVNASQLLSPPIQPGLFDSLAQFAKIDWLYLYKQRRRLENNWNNGRYSTFQLPKPEHPEDAHDECVYTIQYSGNHLVSGSRDKSIKIWDLESQRCLRTLTGAHDQSVLCLQFDEQEDIVVSGGSDSYVVIWKFSTGEIIRKMTNAHVESVLNLRFDHRYLITCSKDKTIKIWNRHRVPIDDPIIPAATRQKFEQAGLQTIEEYTLIQTLHGHNAAVNAIQVHEGQIVSASGDRTIKLWDIESGMCIKTLSGHTKGIACVQFDGRRIVSGSSDNTVRVFDSASSAEVACLSGHTHLVRTVQARFGDLQDSPENLEAEARAVDQRYYNATQNVPRITQQTHGAPRNAGSSNPQAICALGAKIPPGGGGNRWSRIVSGSYDETVIIWKKDFDGKWVQSRKLHQDEILQHPRNQRARNHRAVVPPVQHVVANHQAHPAQNPPTGQYVHNVHGQPVQVPAPPQQTHAPNNPAVLPQQAHQHAVAAAAHAMNASRGRDDSNRVFKLQFDSRRIVCCSQNRIIVGWDFANNDAELKEASRFFTETE